MNKLAAMLFVAVLAGPASAAMGARYLEAASVTAAAAPCQKVKPMLSQNVQGYADSLGRGKCFVSISPVLVPNMVYRAYTFFNDGLMMVFNSYGDGEDSNPNLTSAREFYFFPRVAPLKLEMKEQSPTVAVIMRNGDRVSIAKPTAQVETFGLGSASVSTRIDPAERGGVELTSYSGLVLDGGFRMGGSPTALPNESSTFRDGQGHLCAVENKELFKYAGGEHEFKFSDAQLSAWLATRCPNITVGF